MKHIYRLIVVLFALPTLHAQELTIPTFTQYLADNPFVISPAYAGIGDHVKIRANGLTQWVGIEDAPDNQSLAADMRISANSGVGIFLYNDKNGYTRQYGGRLSYAHHIILDPFYEQYLSFGISYNLNQFKIDIDKIQTPDPSVANNRYTVNHNFDVSMLYRIGRFYASVTGSNILNKNIDLYATNEPKTLRNFQLYTGYTFKSGDRLELEPSAYVQYFQGDGRSSTDINMKARFLNGDDYYWAGISYRFLNDQFGDPLNIGPMAGVKVNNFYFAYSYQITTNELMSSNNGTHMVTIGLDIFQGISDCPCTHGAH